MIASLRGEVIDLGADYCVIECGGVGHLVTITGRLASQLVRHEQTFMLTTMAVREDAITLFGFANSQEREMFALLRTVSTVGPKVAMSVLSVLVLKADLDQVVGALVGLGFPEADANEAAETVVRIDPTLDTSMALKAALKTLGEK